MAVFLKNSWNTPPIRWGSHADIQYAIRNNAERIYGINADSICLNMPLMWGFPLFNYALKYKHLANNYSSVFEHNKLIFNGASSVADAVIPYKTESKSTIIANIGLTADVGVNPTIFSLGNTDTDKEYIRFAIYDSGAGIWPAIVHRKTEYNYYKYTTNQIVLNKDYILTVIQDGVTPIIYINKNAEVMQNLVAAVDPTDWFDDITNPTEARIGRTANSVGGGLLNGEIKTLLIINYDVNSNTINLFNELPYGLYQKVVKPFYFLPIVPTGWAGKINTVTNPSKIMGVSVEDITKVNGIEGE